MAKAPTRAKSPYSVHPGIQSVEDWVRTLREKTGRSLDEWCAFIVKSGPKDEQGRREWLKAKHELGTNTAWWLAEKAGDPAKIAEDTPAGYLALAPAYVNEQYAGKKAHLRPLYDRLLELGLGLGPDVKACPCKTMVPLYREHVFAQMKASTNTRIDLGLALAGLSEGDIPVGAGLIIGTGGREKKDRITHRIELARPEQIDAFVKKWLRTAYDLDACAKPAAARPKPRKML